MNVQHILKDIKQLPGGSSKTEADAKKKVDADVDKVEAEVAQSKAASTHVESDHVEEAEIILEKGEELLGSKGKAPIFEVSTRTLP